MRESDHGGHSVAPSVSDLAAVVLDHEGVVISCTPMAATLLGCSPGEYCAPLRALLSEAGVGPLRHLVYPPAADFTAGTSTLECTVVPLKSHTSESSGARTSVSQWLVLVTSPEGSAETAVRDGERRRLDLSHAAALSIGASLNTTETAQTLVNLLVPDFADLATVDLAEPVLVGDEPLHFAASVDVRLVRIAAAQSPDVSAENLVQVGEALPPVPDNALMRPLMTGHPVVISDMAVLRSMLNVAPEDLRSFIPRGAHSSVAVPLYARGLVLGCVTVWRSQLPSAFGDKDAAILEDVVSRVALSVDNARRFTKEHSSAVALQRSLLPRSALDLTAGETSGVYQPAGGGVGVGGDWFDVIPLPSLRVAFVVGDVVGHGLDATAAMARLRTAVQTLADLDLDPGELLTHLDDLVLGFSAEHKSSDSRSESAVLGATCLYAVYDPATGKLAASTAGHPPPAVLSAGKAPMFLDMTPGPLLGLGGMPFEVAELELKPGSTLAFFTDGLVESRDRDIEEGMGRLLDCLAAADPNQTLNALSQSMLDTLLPPAPADDAALLLARTRSLPPSRIAAWELQADLSLVAHARELVVARLTEWQLDDLSFVTELVVSELVTNAIRYAGGPVGLKLIRDEVLVCEVSDPSTTQPRLRRARETDEGGRGLFLVAQLADRWGSRFTATGKTIWTEQAINGSLV